MKTFLRFALCCGVVGALALSISAREGLAQANSADPALAKRGEKAYLYRGCNFCHTIGRKEARSAEGPDLGGVTDRRTHEWLVSWLKNPNEMFGADPIADAMLEQYRFVKMPNLKLSVTEIESIIAYLSQFRAAS